MKPRPHLWTVVAGPLLGLFLGLGTNRVPSLWGDDAAGRPGRLLLRDGGWVTGEWLVHGGPARDDGTAEAARDAGPAEAARDDGGPGQILWASPALQQPLRVDFDRVRRIAVGQEDAMEEDATGEDATEAGGDEFGFDLGRRGRIFGRLKWITPEAVVIETPLQQWRIPRETLTQMVRSSPERRQVRFASLDEPERVEPWSFDGEGNRLDWTQPAISQRPIDPRNRQAIADALSIPETLLPEDDLAGLIEKIRKEAGRYVDLGLSERSLVRLDIRWQDVPELDIAVGIDHRHEDYLGGFRLQVWDGELVLFRELANDVRLVPLLSSKSFAGSRHWSLMIDLDPTRGRVAVHDASGNLLGEIVVPADDDAWGSGVRLWTGERTRVTSLSAESDAWSSLQNRDFRLPVPPPLVRLTSGRAIAGTVARYDAGEPQVGLSQAENDEAAAANAAAAGSAVTGRDRERATPAAIEFKRWDQWLLRDTAIDSFETAPSTPAGDGGSWRVVTADGWRLNGNAFKVRDRAIELGVWEIDDPIRIPLDRVRSIVWAETPKAAEGAIQKGSGARPIDRQTGEETDGTVGEETGGETAALGRLTADGLSLWGRIASADESPPGNGLPWSVAGSPRPVRLKPHIAAQVVFPARISAWPREQPTAKPAARGGAVRVEAEQVVLGGGLIGGIFGGGGGMRRVVIANQKGSRTSSDPPAAESRVLFLRSGDTIPAEVTSIDASGVHFDSPTIDQGFVPHERVRSVILRELDRPKQIDTKTRDRLLLIPRAARDDPPTHLVCSTSGDFVRGRLESLDDRFVRMEVRLESLRIPRDRVAQIFWLHPPEPNERGDDRAIAASGGDPAATDGRVRPGRPVAGPGEVNDLRGPSYDQDGRNGGAAPLRMQAWRGDGTRLSFEFRDCVDGTTILGFDPDLGDCQVRVGELDRLLIGAAISDVPPGSAFADWRPRHAPLPKAFLPGQQAGDAAGDDGIRSAMVGQEAPPFELETLAGPRYRLADARGKVVVLDFWASWCGPCIQAMPVIDEVTREFDADEVSLVAVNLQEEPQTVRATLERLGLEPTVVLDRRGAVAESYGVTAIPQTVIVGPDGKIARLYVGSHASLAESLREAIRELLDATK